MKAKEMLRSLATRYLQDGPMRRQSDAQTILQVVDQLDEESAKIYLERFVAKWKPVTETPAMAKPVMVSTIRRRPMSELEQRVYVELLLGDTPTTTSAPNAEEADQVHEEETSTTTENSSDVPLHPSF